MSKKLTLLDVVEAKKTAEILMAEYDMQQVQEKYAKKLSEWGVRQEPAVRGGLTKLLGY